MRKLLTALSLMVIVSCSDDFKEELDAANGRIQDLTSQLNSKTNQLNATQSQLDAIQGELELSQVEIEALQEAVDSVYVNFDKAVAREHQDLITESVQSIMFSIVTSAYQNGYGIIDTSEFKLSFFVSQHSGLYAQGEFCVEDIPVLVNVPRYLELSVQRRNELILHEFSHSYFNYLHPQDYNNIGVDWNESDPIGIMDAERWLPSFESWFVETDRFWDGEGQEVKPCEVGESSTFKCNKEWNKEN